MQNMIAVHVRKLVLKYDLLNWSNIIIFPIAAFALYVIQCMVFYLNRSLANSSCQTGDLITEEVAVQSIKYRDEKVHVHVLSWVEIYY